GGAGVGYFDLIGVAVGVPGVEPGCWVKRGALAMVTMVARRKPHSMSRCSVPSLSVMLRLASRIRPLAEGATGTATEIRREMPPAPSIPARKPAAVASSSKLAVT